MNIAQRISIDAAAKSYVSKPREASDRRRLGQCGVRQDIPGIRPVDREKSWCRWRKPTPPMSTRP